MIPRGVYSRHAASSCSTCGGLVLARPRRSHSSSAGPWNSAGIAGWFVFLRGEEDWEVDDLGVLGVLGVRTDAARVEEDDGGAAVVADCVLPGGGCGCGGGIDLDVRGY